MNVHDLKTDHEAFQNTVSGNKCFEIRKNDRYFNVGDILILRETSFTGMEMNHYKQPLEYTKSYAVVMVTNILHGPVYGLMDHWVIMSIEVKSVELVKNNDAVDKTK